MNEQKKHEHGHGEDLSPVAGDQENAVRSERQGSTDLATLMGDSSPCIVTPVLIAISTLIFVTMVLTGSSIMSPTSENLMKWGANFGPSSTSGEYYRLLTAAFVHIGIIHIVFNMACLFDLGLATERVYGSVSFLLLYILSALGGSVASMVVQPAIVSAGASGAVFGTAGALLAFFIRNKDDLPPGLFSRQVKNMGGFVVYNLIFGFSISGIDNAAHIGGLATGFLCGYVLCPTMPYGQSKSRITQSIIVCAVATFCLGAGFFVASSRVNSLDPALRQSPAENAKLLNSFNSYVDKLRPILKQQDATVNKLAKLEVRINKGIAKAEEIDPIKIEFIKNIADLVILNPKKFETLNGHMIERAKKLKEASEALRDVINNKERAAEKYSKLIEGAGADLDKFTAEKDKFMKAHGFVIIK